jgi:hypothetical protein
VFCGGSIYKHRTVVTAAHCFVMFLKESCKMFTGNQTQNLSCQNLILSQIVIKANRLNLLDNNEKGVDYKVSSVKILPFDETRLNNDIAIVYVEPSPETAPNEVYLSPIELDSKNGDLKSPHKQDFWREIVDFVGGIFGKTKQADSGYNRNLKVAGWGQTKANGNTVYNLMEAEVDLVEPQSCRNVLVPYAS